jgi:hypothetical protein
MYNVILGLSSLVLIYGVIAIIGLTIRAALKARNIHPSAGGGKPSTPHAGLEDKQTDEPYYQPICHHSHPLHITK